jgi:hypothetical protein
MGLAVVDGNRPSSSLLAEYLRASLCSAYDGNPVHIHTILGVTEERLSSVFSFQSSLQSKLFREENDDDSSRIELKEVLGWLVEIGDVINVGNGLHFPAPTRAVALPGGEFAVISGSASDQLERDLGHAAMRGSMGRVLGVAPASLPQQLFADWLALPPMGLSAWTKHALAMPLPSLITDAATWQVAHFNADGLRFEAPIDSDLGTVPVIARVKRERMRGYQRFLVRLRRDGKSVSTIAARELHFHECSRLLNGVRLDRGQQFEVRATSTAQGDIAITTNVYHLPEVITLLTFFSAHRSQPDDTKLSFIIPSQYKRRLSASLAMFAVKLNQS